MPFELGTDSELEVAKQLSDAGAHVVLERAPLGAADIVARFRTGRTWVVEVKGSGGIARLEDRKLARRLSNRADRLNATPVLAEKVGTQYKWQSARNGRLLKI